ncbi:unnamed protein product [Penicillium roqueforti FM164]|uniref:Uncharacterized protein n=1 Tax=Penicillium roqueforti (strain FM164) TaxID=1365484 RepID=W6R9A7_PENRF|nr:unnamed protein product [Penicillium roqueforti FM164]
MWLMHFPKLRGNYPWLINKVFLVKEKREEPFSGVSSGSSPGSSSGPLYR